MNIDAGRVPAARPVRLMTLVFAGVLLAILFQVGHFAEHVIQVTAWIFGDRTAPYMTSLGMWLMDWLGTTAFPSESVARQKKLGFELLHLVGNLIYVVGTLGLWYFIRSRAMIVANFFQVFHVLEHISLTVSYYFLNVAVGMSTLYGMPLEHMFSVAYRVWWHFFANAIPTVIVLYVLYSVFYTKDT